MLNINTGHTPQVETVLECGHGQAACIVDEIASYGPIFWSTLSNDAGCVISIGTTISAARPRQVRAGT